MARIAIILFVYLLNNLAIAQDFVKEEVQLTNNQIVLPGTLTYPKSNKKIPLVLFIHGSGNVDRNGNQAGVNVNASYIQQLADSLTKKGIAFYRYDKRTATKENLPLFNNNITINDFAADARVAIDHFKNDNRFSEIILIGHSQGSLVAMLTAQQGNVSKYISLAGPSESIDKTLIKQVTAQDSLLGKKTAEYIKELKETDTITQVHPLLMSIFAPQNFKFLKNWSSYNPKEEITKLNIPILIIQGDADIQVSVEDAQELHEAAKGSKLVIIPNMNHPLKTVNNATENQQSYYSANFPLSTVLVTTITEFLTK